MSGGAFDHQHHRMQDMIDRIESELERQGKDKPKEELWGSPKYYEDNPSEKKWPTYSGETQKILKEAVERIKEAYIYAHQVDLFLSGDTGENSLKQRIQEELFKSKGLKSAPPFQFIKNV